jgi:hypothetical protein
VSSKTISPQRHRDTEKTQKNFVFSLYHCLSVVRTSAGDTIAVMAKFKPVKGKKPKATGPPPGGLACVTLVIVGMILVGLLLYFAMRNSA